MINFDIEGGGNRKMSSGNIHDKKIYKRVLLKMCENNQVYNKMNDKVMLNRYSGNEDYEEDFSQLECFEKLIDYWDQFNEHKKLKDCSSTR